MDSKYFSSTPQLGWLQRGILLLSRRGGKGGNQLLSKVVLHASKRELLLYVSLKRKWWYRVKAASWQFKYSQLVPVKLSCKMPRFLMVLFYVSIMLEEISTYYSKSCLGNTKKLNMYKTKLKASSGSGRWSPGSMDSNTLRRGWVLHSGKVE